MRREDRLGTVISGSSFEEVKFVLVPGKRVSPGELVKGRVNDNTFVVCRVRNCEAISLYDDARRIHIRDLLGLETEGHVEEGVASFLVATAVPIEELTYDGKEWICKEVSNLLTPGSSVYKLDPQDIVALLKSPEPRRGIVLGRLYGSNVPVILDPNEVLPRHVLIVGTTGTGKSYALGVITEELHKLGIRHVHVDVHGEFIKTAEELGGEVMVPGKDLTVRLSSLTELEVMGLIPFLTELQGEIVRRAFLELKKEKRAFDVDDLLRKIDEVATWFRAREETWLNAKARAELLKHVRIIGRGTDWLSKLEKPGAFINIDCRDLSHSQLQALVSALARELLELLRNDETRRKLRGIVLSIDEAHLFLPYRRAGEIVPSATVLSEIIRFGRHYGLCLILVTPSPVDIDRRVVRTTNTRLIFAIEPDQLSAMEGALADTPREVRNRLMKLRRGVCLLTGTYETVPHAILVEIRRRRTTHGGETPRLID